jgi:Winged helix DNA-binding domain
VIRAIEHLVGLQAQAPFPPYFGLWSRLDGFRPDDLSSLITDRSAVRIALMRGTIHLGLARLVTRYLGAFGPATVRDAQAWSGLTGLKTVIDQLRPSLVTFRDEQGAELFDLPSAPRPGGDVPAPVRLVAEFDNLVLSHADRSRVVSAENFRRLSGINGIFPGSVLVDGFVAGIWRLARNKSTATLTIELFGPVRERDSLVDEAGRMLTFCAPGASHDVRFAPVA